MIITKKNGITVLYDDEKIIRSILRANAEVPLERMAEKQAAVIAAEAVKRILAEREILTTAELRGAIYELLCEKGFRQTAEHYMAYRK